MDIEMLEFRSFSMQAVRSFLSSNGFLEVDTPALSHSLIPESCLEVFKSEYIKPYKDERIPLFLAPSPEVYIKELIAKHKRSFFQLSKCYRNLESVGQLHSPEFTMLEYYAVNKDYKFSIELTQNLLLHVASKLKDSSLLSFENVEIFRDFGFDIDEFSEDEIVIRAVPAFDFRDSIENVFLQLLMDLKNEVEIKDLRENIIISMSCKGAVKAGQKLDTFEMQNMVRRIHEVGEYTCPHGRPIIVKLSRNDLDKMFGRRK